MTNEEAIRVISRSSMLLVRVKEHRDAVEIALNALKTSDKAVEQAINKIAIELEEYVFNSCTQETCPCFDKCNPKKTCKEWIAEWMKGIVEEVSE